MVVQISDLHVSVGHQNGSVKLDTQTSLHKALEHIKSFGNLVEAVMLSGDITDFGKEEEYIQVRNILQDYRFPIYIIAGNHDKREPLRKILSPLTEFSHPYYCTFFYVGKQWVWIGLDSLIEGQVHGEICQEQLSWLTEKLKEHPQLPHILFFHHPPFKVGIEKIDGMQLKNKSSLEKIILSSPQIKGIACGHLHRPITALWNSVPVWVAPAHNYVKSFHLEPNAQTPFNVEPASLRFFTLAEGNIISYLSYIKDF